MKALLKQLITEYNSKDEGIVINTEINDYVDKLANNAIILTYYDQKIKGFIAFYANNKDSDFAFLSMIIVDKSIRGLGIGKMLIIQSEKILSKKGFSKYRLEVLKSNNAAINLYYNLGFKNVDSKEEVIVMEKKLL